LAGKFGLTMDSYLTLLKEERDISPNEYSTEIIWPMLALRRLVADQVQVTDDEFNRAYIAQFGEAIKCRMIMVGSHPKAIELQQQAAANPKMFGQIAKTSSEDESSASVDGLIPPIRRYAGNSRLEEAAFALKDNEVSEVMQLGDQWIILQAVRRIPTSTPSPKALPAIREQIKDRIRDQKMRGAATELFAKLQQEAQVQKVLGNPELSKQYPGAAAIINGQQLNVSIVAESCMKRHGSEVLEGEINRKLLTQALRKANKQVTAPDLEAEVKRAAASYGFTREDGSADVDAWVESVTREANKTQELYIRDSVWPSVALMKLVEDDVKLTPRDMQEGFESAYGPRVEVLAIVLSDQRSAQKVWEMARDNPTEMFFGKLAEQYSVEPVSSSNLGRVPPIRKYSGQPALEKEAFAMQPGELSGIIATGGRYVLLRCQGFTEPVVSDPAEVRQELARDLTEKKLNQAMLATFEQLKNDSEITNFMAAKEKTARVATKP
ncbi:MAG: peptidylprolyl isomerase, partial [Rubripirellula sp.]